MTLTLDLPAELERELSTEANQLGLSLPEYALRILSSGRAPINLPRNGAELVAYWQRERLIGTRMDIGNDQQYARELRARAERRFEE